METLEQTAAQPIPDGDAQQFAARQKDTTPDTVPNENSQPKVPVKFNKQTRELTIDEAATLAQKGMKYESIYNDLERLKKIASVSGRNLSDYISVLENEQTAAHKTSLLEKCHGDEKLAEEFMSLEGKKADTVLGLDELIRNVESVNCADDVPEEVMQAAKLKGGNLFDEYLRYLFVQNRKAQEALSSREKWQEAGVGSQSTAKRSEDAASAEFLKGIWN